jgi:FAD/FMN-containing dehydrogenase
VARGRRGHRGDLARLVTADYHSWGRWPVPSNQQAQRLWSSHQALPDSIGTILPRGLGRSYGDSCTNSGGTLLLTEQLDRFIAFDETSGRLTCEGGISLDAILRAVVPRGWFLPVTPGTRFVTLGGAIANDVHGKNHHVAGTIGRHISRMWIRRSDSPDEVQALDPSAPLFAATIGGLGLTGLIVAAEITLRRIESVAIDQETTAFQDIASFIKLSAAASGTHEYTVAWFDCLHQGRGIFFRGNHAPADPAVGDHGTTFSPPKLRVPFSAPAVLLNRMSVRTFNSAYYWRMRRRAPSRVSCRPFFYPLDAVQDWNRLYGRRGFVQWQCVVPPDPDARALSQIVRAIAGAGAGSFLSVIKVFGDQPSPGMLSFPRPGVTLAVDFAMRGRPTLALLDRLDAIVIEAGGAIYPAKDARMSPNTFQRSFPRLSEFTNFLDPRFSSSFWRRVGA